MLSHKIAVNQATQIQELDIWRYIVRLLGRPSYCATLYHLCHLNYPKSNIINHFTTKFHLFWSLCESAKLYHCQNSTYCKKWIFERSIVIFFIKPLLCNTVFCFAWSGVEGTAEIFTLSFERSQRMLRIMPHKGNSFKFVSLLKNCKNIMEKKQRERQLWRNSISYKKSRRKFLQKLALL